MSNTLPADNARTAKWADHFVQYSPAQIAKHSWEYKGGNWVPSYEFQTLATIAEAWTEWVDGLNGFFPV
jgi:hypothetical protein